MFKQKAALAVLLVTCAFASMTAANAADSTPPLEPKLMTYIEEQCELRDIDPELALAIIRIESTFKPESISADGNCYGLMQIHKVNFKMLREKLGVTNLLDPYQNVEAGIYMISGYIHEYDNIHSALMAYNIGEAGAKKLWNKGLYSSRYSRQVVEYMNGYIASGIFDSIDNVSTEKPVENITADKPAEEVTENKTAGAVTVVEKNNNNKNTIRFVASSIFSSNSSGPYKAMRTSVKAAS